MKLNEVIALFSNVVSEEISNTGSITWIFIKILNQTL